MNLVYVSLVQRSDAHSRAGGYLRQGPNPWYIYVHVFKCCSGSFLKWKFSPSAIAACTNLLWCVFLYLMFPYYLVSRHGTPDTPNQMWYTHESLFIVLA